MLDIAGWKPFKMIAEPDRPRQLRLAMFGSHFFQEMVRRTRESGIHRFSLLNRGGADLIRPRTICGYFTTLF
jgi:hypothetical protein